MERLEEIILERLKEIIIEEGVLALAESDPRQEKLRDYRSGGHRRWPSFSSGRYRRTGWGNYLQTAENRKIRRVPVVDRHGEGIVPVYHKTVDF